MTKIPQDILRTLFKNIVNTEIVSDFIFPERFTKQQLGIFSADPHLRSRSLCTSGISIDFYSNTDRIKLYYTVYEKAREWMYFDLFINDVYIESSGFDTIQNESGSVEFYINNTRKEKNRITIYLPHLVRAAISGLEISSGAAFSKIRKHKNTILCLGDSITQGMEAKHPSSIYTVQLARHFNMYLINQGVGGYVFNKKSLDSNFEFSPKIITVAYGTNDWEKAAAISEFYENASGYLKLLREKFPHVKIIVISPTWRTDINEPKRCGAFSSISSALAEICERISNLILIDGLTMIPNDPSFFTDGLHPSDKGFEHFSRNLISRIETELAKKN